MLISGGFLFNIKTIYMSYREIKGDLLELYDKGEFDLIMHGCNCQSAMTGGIAAKISERYPSAYYADLYDKRSPNMKLGSYSIDYSRSIYNLYTQYFGGSCFDEIAFINSLRQLTSSLFNEDALQINSRIGLPQIGCGIGGGKWSRVKKIIKQELKDYNVTVVKYVGK